MNHLQAISATGNWLPWIQFFLQGVREQAQDATSRSTRLFELAQSYRERLQKAKASGSALVVMDSLFSDPAITIPRARELLGSTYKGAQYVIEGLIAVGILSELQKSARPRVFYASEIIELVDPSADPS